MRGPSPRRFTLLDVMILVAATALGLAVDRAALVDIPSYGSATSDAIFTGLVAALPILAMWTFAWLVLRLRAPRPAFRRLARQPGFVACVAAATALMLCGASGAIFLISGSRFRVVVTSFVGYTPQFSFIVIGAWLALAINRRWRPEPDWIDRLGRALGVLWIAADVLHWVRLVLL